MHRRTSIIGLAAAAALTLVFPSPAFAAPGQVEHWEDEGSNVLEVGAEDWCPADVVDFEVTHSWVGSGVERISADRNGILHFANTFKWVDTFSANGSTFVLDRHGHGRDHEIVDNGDGTLTIWFKESVRTNVLVDGEKVLHNAGLAEGELLVDHGGTPGDPDDDEFIAEVDFQLHGRWDTADRDFCADIALFLGD